MTSSDTDGSLPPDRGKDNISNVNGSVRQDSQVKRNDEVYTLDNFRSAKSEGTFDHVVLVHHSLKSDEIRDLIAYLAGRSQVSPPPELQSTPEQ